MACWQPSAQGYLNVASRVPNSLLRLRALATESFVLVHILHRKLQLVIAILGLSCRPDVAPARGGMQLAGSLLCATGAVQVVIPLQPWRCTSVFKQARWHRYELPTPRAPAVAGRAGVPMEVMGLMLGEFVDEYTVKVVDVFAMPQSGTGVSVEAVDPVFQTKMLDMLKQTGRHAPCRW